MAGRISPFAKNHFKGRTVHTKRGMYLFASSLAAASRGEGASRTSASSVEPRVGVGRVRMATVLSILSLTVESTGPGGELSDLTEETGYPLRLG